MPKCKSNFAALCKRQKQRRLKERLMINARKKIMKSQMFYTAENGNNGSSPKSRTDPNGCTKNLSEINLDMSDTSDSNHSNVLREGECKDLVFSKLEVNEFQPGPNCDNLNKSCSELTESVLVENKDDQNRFLNTQCKADCSELLQNHLKNWIASEKNVPRLSVNRLLQSLSEDFNLPVTVSTLLKDEKCESAHSMMEGEYIHFGNWIDDISKYLSSVVTNTDRNLTSKFSLVVNIDGLNLFNALSSSKYSAYPILVKILEFPQKIFCAGIFCSNSFESKCMPDPNIFLEQFVDNIRDGVKVNGRNIVCNLKAFVCDAPVRATLKSIMSHSGYNSCERCTIHGTYEDGTVVFSNTSCTPRSDESFNSRQDKSHHKSFNPNILESINFPMVSGFLLDIMHVCYLGIVKRILNRLLNLNLKQKSVRLDAKRRDFFDAKLKEYQSYIPSEFSRKLEGGISTVLKWKATQYRLFALYISIVLFKHKKLVSKEFYQNFLLFAISMRLLSVDNQKCNLDFIKKMQIKFVKDAQVIYGKSFACYNVHAFTHLTEDYSRFGSLDRVSAFSFESYLGCNVKGAVRSGFKPLQQIGKHINRINHQPYVKIQNEPKFSKRRECCHELDGVCYSKVVTNNIILKPVTYSKKDCYVVLKTGHICEVITVHECNSEPLFQMHIFKNVDNFFTEPLLSTEIGIYKIEKNNYSDKICVLGSDIYSKLFVLPYKNNYLIAMIMIHNEQS